MRIAFALSALALMASVVAPSAASGGSRAPAWCAPETEALSESICHFDGNRDAGGRRTLVVFLHGLVPRSSDWQWMQQRAILREAKLFHFAALMPQAPPVGPHGAGGYAWPGGGSAREDESAMVEAWARAQRQLEARAGRPFDEVFVVGFSSGAYFATSLALRDRMKADGYVVLAGGAPGSVTGESPPHRAPVFIGVSARDRATAPQARALGQALTARAWPHRVDEQPIGHMVGDVHMAHALAYLRARVDEAAGRTGAFAVSGRR